jgi:hypothetical protein
LTIRLSLIPTVAPMTRQFEGEIVADKARAADQQDPLAGQMPAHAFIGDTRHRRVSFWLAPVVLVSRGTVAFCSELTPWPHYMRP